MASPSSIGVGNNFPTGQSCISCGASDNKSATWIENVFGIDKQLFGDGVFNNILDEVASDLLVTQSWVVLARNENSVHSDWSQFYSLFIVLNSDLHLGIWSHPGHNFLFPALLNSSH